MQWCFSQANAVVGTQTAWDLRCGRRRGILFLFLVARALLLTFGLFLTLAIQSILLLFRDSRLLSQG